MIYIDLFGVAVAALSGALVAARKEMDIYGFLVLGLMTGIGGGTLRDVILDAPVFWVAREIYLIIGLLAAFVAYIFAREAMNGWRRRFILVFDAAALGFFAASGTLKALTLDASYIVAIAMGLMTAVAGGMLRDVMAQETPVIFRGEIYATAALLGSIVVVFGYALSLPTSLILTAGVLATFVTRLLAVRFEWRLSTSRRVDD